LCNTTLAKLAATSSLGVFVTNQSYPAELFTSLASTVNYTLLSLNQNEFPYYLGVELLPFEPFEPLDPLDELLPLELFDPFD